MCEGCIVSVGLLMFGNNRSECVVSSPEQPKYKSEQMLLSVLKKRIVAATILSSSFSVDY